VAKEGRSKGSTFWRGRQGSQGFAPCVGNFGALNNTSKNTPSQPGPN